MYTTSTLQYTTGGTVINQFFVNSTGWPVDTPTEGGYLLRTNLTPEDIVKLKPDRRLSFAIQIGTTMADLKKFEVV